LSEEDESTLKSTDQGRTKTYRNHNEELCRLGGISTRKGLMAWEEQCCQMGTRKRFWKLAKEGTRGAPELEAIWKPVGWTKTLAFAPMERKREFNLQTGDGGLSKRAQFEGKDVRAIVIKPFARAKKGGMQGNAHGAA